MDYIRIRLESDLCAASGESSGNAVDSDICINAYGLPFIPARRIKGCLRASAMELKDLGADFADEDNINAIFGDPFGSEGVVRITDGNMAGVEALNRFLDEVKKSEDKSIYKKAAHPSNVINIFCDVLGQTKMKNGVKVDNSLRMTRVLKQYDPLAPVDKKAGEAFKLEFDAPVELETVKDEKRRKEIWKLLEASCKALRHIGLNRTRGLGNINAELIHGTNDTHADHDTVYKDIDELVCRKEDMIEIPYYVYLDAPVSIPGINEYETEIPGRSVIGCMAGMYLKEHEADETFRDLFLNGTVKWSGLTPVISGEISAPTPMMLVELKNGGKRKINRYTQADPHWMGMKPKTMDGSYAVLTEKGYKISDPLMQMTYHHSISKEMLYTQSALENGMVYGGRVFISGGDKELAVKAVKLLENGRMRFGRSRSAQYSSCSLKAFGKPSAPGALKQIEKDEIVFIVLQTDLVVMDEGVFQQNTDIVRKAVAERMAAAKIRRDDNGDPVRPDGYIDICQYKTLSGYQASWHLQKPHIPAVKAGSVYCFVSDGGSAAEYISVGEYLQEGCGRCRIFTLNELKEKQEIQDDFIDIKVYDNNEYREKQLKTALLVYTAKETMRRYAREYIVTDRNIPISRLRLMLSEAGSYSDLLNRVRSMKTSDISSANEKGKNKISQELLSDFYGDKEQPLKKMLCTEVGLYEELEQNPEAKQEVDEMWKLPMGILLHNMHYKKGR